MMVRRKTAEAEIDEIINEADKERRRKRRYTSVRCKKPTGPGEKCLYSWTCGPETMVAAHTPQSALIGSDL